MGNKEVCLLRCPGWQEEACQGSEVTKPERSGGNYIEAVSASSSLPGLGLDPVRDLAPGV